MVVAVETLLVAKPSAIRRQLGFSTAVCGVCLLARPVEAATAVTDATDADTTAADVAASADAASVVDGV